MNTSQTIVQNNGEEYLPPKKNPELTALKKRMFDIRDELPGNSVDIFIARHPEYNNKKGISKLTNALTTFTVNEEIVERFEVIAKDYQQYLEDTEAELQNKKSAA